MKAIKKYFLFLLLFGFSSSAFALPGNPMPTDVSMSFLSQVFGTVGNVLQGSNGQLLGRMFEVFNAGVLVLAGVWLSYSVVTVVLRSSQEGSFMGQNKNVAVLFLRIALGFALTIPMPSTGYSTVQVMLMDVVTQGVKLADYTWNAALDYMTAGGRLYQTPTTDGMKDLTKLKKNLFTGDAAAAKQVFLSEVCMFRSQYYQQQDNAQTGNGNAYTGQFNLQADSSKNLIQFPGYGNQIPVQTEPQCGSLIGVGGDEAADKANGSSFAAIQGLAENMLPAAKKYADCVLGDKSYCGSQSEVEDAISQNMFQSLLAYDNLIKPYAQKKSSAAKKLEKQLKDEAEDAGWIMAGRYYWDLLRLNQAQKAAKVSNQLPVANQTLTSKFSKDEKQAKKAFSTYSNGVTDVLQQYISAQENTVTAKDGKRGYFRLKRDKSMGFLKVITAGINPLLNDFKKVDSNPMLFLMNVGRDAIGAASGIFITGLVLIGLLSIPAGTCDSVNPGGVLINNLVSWVKPLAFGIAGALIVPGVILGFYLPLYPYILFTFGSISWLMIVLEGMVAAPLVAFGMTHPEGHDFLGRAEQALMLALGVFLRPVLMVIGLIAAMILSYVALHLIIMGFTYILSDITSSTMAIGGSQSSGTLMSSVVDTATANDQGDVLLVAIIVPALLVMFSSLVYKIVQQCFSLIYELPNNIMQWIGGPQKQDQTAMLAQQVEQSTSGASKAAGDQVTQGAGGLAEAGGRFAGSQLKSNNGKGSSSIDTQTGGGSDGGGGGAEPPPPPPVVPV